MTLPYAPLANYIPVSTGSGTLYASQAMGSIVGPATVTVTDAFNDSIVTVITADHQTTGTPTNGIGTRIALNTENSANASVSAATFSARLTSVISASEVSEVLLAARGSNTAAAFDLRTILSMSYASGVTTMIAGDSDATTAPGSLVLRSPNASSGDTAGGAFTINSGRGRGLQPSGTITITPGITGPTATGGQIIVQAADGGTTTGIGGAISIIGGSAVAGNSAGGAVSFTAGSGFGSAIGGSLSLGSGTGGATGGGGTIFITSGSGGSTSGSGGQLSITSGSGVGTNASGGLLTISGGTATGAGTASNISIIPGDHPTTASLCGRVRLRNSANTLTVLGVEPFGSANLHSVTAQSGAPLAAVGPITSNTPSGRIAFTNDATSYVVQNTLVAATSHVFVTIVAATTANRYILSVVPAADQFTITLDGLPGVSGLTISFFVVNPSA